MNSYKILVIEYVFENKELEKILQKQGFQAISFFSESIDINKKG